MWLEDDERAPFAQEPNGRKKTTMKRLSDACVSIMARGLISALLWLPYEKRVSLAGRMFSSIIAPVAGFNKRVRDNLSLVMPDIPENEVKSLQRGVCDNIGRTIIEFFSGQEFIDYVRDTPITGPGAQVLANARDARQPVILVGGHIGNYDVVRAVLIANGYRVGGLYRPMKNNHFNSYYVSVLSKIGTPLFPQGRRGMIDVVKFVRSGGMIGLLMDQNSRKGATLKFFDHDAPTATTAADLAVKFNAPLIPIYSIRRDNGLDFRIIAETAIPHGDRKTMSQAINDNLEKQVRAHMDQWFWIHRRWKRK